MEVVEDADGRTSFQDLPRQWWSEAIATQLGFNLALRCVSVGYFFWLARQDSFEDLGAFTFVMAIAQTYATVLDFGLMTWTVPFTEEEVRDQLGRVRFPVAIASVALAGAMLLGRPGIERMVGAPVSVALSVAGATTIIGGAFLGLQQTVLRRERHFRSLTVAQSIATLCGLASGMVTFGLRGSVSLSLALQAFVTTVMMMVTVAVLSRRFGTACFVVDGGSLRIGSLAHALLTISSEAAGRRVDDLAIGLVVGAAALGQYNVAYRIFLLVTSLTAESILPIYVRLFADTVESGDLDRSSFVNAIARRLSLGAGVIGLGLVGVGVAVLSGRVTAGNWRVVAEALSWLLMAAGLQVRSAVDRSTLVAYGRTGSVLVMQASSTLAQAVGFVVVARDGVVAIAMWVCAVSAWSMLSSRLLTARLGSFFNRLEGWAVAIWTMVAAGLIANLISSHVPWLAALITIGLMFGVFVTADRVLARTGLGA